MRIGSIDTADRPVVVGEIGNNHEGDVRIALDLVAAAADAGADAIKLQAVKPDEFVRPTETARLKQLERFALSLREFEQVADAARNRGLGFICTPLYLGAVDWLAPMVDALKVASGDNDVPQLLDAVAASGRPVMFSTGMSTSEDVRFAYDRLRSGGAEEIGILHCVSAYPTPPSDASLASIPELATQFPGATVGYSDHTLGIDAAVAAVGLGARIIEKHITLRRDFSDFRDHQLSAEPDELAQLVRRVRDAVPPQDGDVLLGTPKHEVLPIEEPTARAARRSLAAAMNLKAGQTLAEGDLIWLRPRDGFPPSAEPELLGRRLARDVARGQALTQADLAD